MVSGESIVMKTPARSPRIVAAIAAFSMASIAWAQRPLRGGPDSPDPFPGPAGSGYPAPLGRIVLPTPEPTATRKGVFWRNSSRAGDATVTQVQRALKQRGYYSGPVDGEAGAGTRGAIRDFRREKGMGSSVKIDPPLVRALGL